MEPILLPASAEFEGCRQSILEIFAFALFLNLPLFFLIDLFFFLFARTFLKSNKKLRVIFLTLGMILGILLLLCLGLRILLMNLGGFKSLLANIEAILIPFSMKKLWIDPRSVGCV